MAPEQFALPVGLRAAGSLAAFRYADYDVPFWARPNSREGRWHVLGDEPTQYWSTSPDGAWAELIRASELHAEHELDLVRMPLWACRVSMLGVINLHGADEQARCSLTAQQMIDDDWNPCQRAARELRQRCRAIIAPNPALEAHASLTLFGARRAIDWRATSMLASTLPAAVVAVGRPPPGLIPRVRRRTGSAPQARLFEDRP